MNIWTFDENRVDFVSASLASMEGSPDAIYIIQHGDVLMVREDGRERPMPERLEVAGVMFDREQFLDCLQVRQYSLSDMVAQCDKDAPPPADGKEIL